MDPIDLDLTLDELALWASNQNPKAEAGWTGMPDACPVYWYLRHGRGMHEVTRVTHTMVMERSGHHWSLPLPIRAVIERVDVTGARTPESYEPRRVSFADLLNAIRYARWAHDPPSRTKDERS